MPSPVWLAWLQWAITLSGVFTFILSWMSWTAAMRGRRALKRSGRNGALRAEVITRVTTSSVRMCAATISVGGGISLLVLPNFAIVSGVVAAVCWLTYNLLMGVNLVVGWWARVEMATALASKEALTLIDEMVMQRIERTAERLERTAERLERQHDRERAT